MGKFKDKAKKIWEENKGLIAFCATAAAVAGVGLIASKSYQAGFVDGGMTGVQVGAKWLDKTFPGESNACELLDRYAKENPDQIVHRKGPGKWS